MLQATRVFKFEVTRQNRMRWLNSYCFRRTSAILASLASCGHSDDDPRVDALWPSTDEGEARSITIPVSAFAAHLDDAQATIRVNAVLHVCSAFESLLDGLLMLGAMYSPASFPTTRKQTAIPAALGDPKKLTALVGACEQLASGKTTRLKGAYSGRIQSLCTSFGLSAPKGYGGLDQYYTKRHVVAHDQSLSKASSPLHSYQDIVASQILVSDVEWRALMKDFLDIARALDREFVSTLVTDSGLAIAVHQVLAASTPITIGKVRNAVSTQWGLERSDKEIESVAKSIGRTVSTEKKVFRRVVS
ncbi:MAG: hypothetical protein H6716_26815 [Polyangiaceae bacterium]|nr:hypothetical protein [Polyangiaceae bacterium]